MYIICAGKISIWRKSAGAKAVEDTLALCISYDRLHEAPDAASILYGNIAKALAERLTIANNVIVFQSPFKHYRQESPHQ